MRFSQVLFQRRTEQYLSRGNLVASTGFAVSLAFTNAIQSLAGIPVRVAFECIMILHWPEAQPQTGNAAGVSQTSQNELNYCESLFIYLFQKLNLSYNSTTVSPTNSSSLTKPVKPPVPNPNALQPSRQLGGNGKPCRIGGKNYMSLKDYETYHKQELNRSVNRKRMRDTLKTKPTNPSDLNYDKDNHYLVGEELQVVIQTDGFVKYDRTISVK